MVSQQDEGDTEKIKKERNRKHIYKEIERNGKHTEKEEEINKNIDKKEEMNRKHIDKEDQRIIKHHCSFPSDLVPYCHMLRQDKVACFFGSYIF